MIRARVRVRPRVMYSFGVMVRVRVGITDYRVYVKPFCSAEKP